MLPIKIFIFTFIYFLIGFCISHALIDNSKTNIAITLFYPAILVIISLFIGITIIYDLCYLFHAKFISKKTPHH